MAKEDGEVELPIAALKRGYSPRRAGDGDHAKLLARTGAPLPAVLVRRQTMEIIDGHHRLVAARLRGEKTIRARLLDIAPNDARLLAIRANITHGKPLSLLEREAAAHQVLERQPELSDRMVAECCGLAPGTVKRIRERATSQNGQLSRRLGRDGRRRPADAALLRKEIAVLLRERPGVPINQIARIVGSSPNTVRSVKKRLEQSVPRPTETEMPTPGASEEPYQHQHPDPDREVAFRDISAWLAAAPAMWGTAQLGALPRGIRCDQLRDLARAARDRSREWLSIARELAKLAETLGQ